MSALSKESCEACNVDAPKLSDSEIKEMHAEIPKWEVVEQDGEKQFQRVFPFKNFAQALEFGNKVGELAEQYQHHPAITIEWGKVSVAWWTHKIGGLHRNDAVMAAKTDAIFND